jgi:hypothetical protein
VNRKRIAALIATGVLIAGAIVAVAALRAFYAAPRRLEVAPWRVGRV